MHQYCIKQSNPMLPQKPKKQKQKLPQKFKQQCLKTLRKQPPSHFLTSLKDKTVLLDLDLFHSQDLPFFSILTKLPITKIHLFSQQSKKPFDHLLPPIYETHKFKDLLKDLSQLLSESKSLKSLKFQRIPLTIKHILELKQSLTQTQSLKQFSLKQCNLTDDHLQSMKKQLSKNQSLVILDLSKNKLCNSGDIIGKIMYEHSLRRDQLIWQASLRGETLQDDLSKKGICEVNLQSNDLTDKTAFDIVSYLKDDQWMRCLNLNTNKLTLEGVKSFCRLMKKNSTIISLDLRGNPGFNKQFSTYILKRLKINIQMYRQEKNNYKSKKNKQDQQLINKYQNSNPNNDHHKSLQQHRKFIQNKKSQNPTKIQLNLSNNMIINHKSSKNIQNKFQVITDQKCCQKCRLKTLQVLKLQKNNLDLQIQIKKLKYILLTKNIDISAILPHYHQSTLQNPSQTNQSFNRATQLSVNTNSVENDQDVILRVQQIMLELTKIMDNIDAHQNTQINLSNNNTSNGISLSQTIPLYANPSQMEELEESSIRHQNQNNRLDSQQIIN